MDNSKKALTGVKKRQQIKDANKMTFIWIIIASASVVLCLVIAQFLVRQLWHNQKVINEQSKTQSTLQTNLKNYETLKKEVEKLVANADLAKVKADPNDSAYKVVLDALPVTNDGTVLGSSLLQVILPKSQVSIKDLTAGIDENSLGVATTVAENTIPFKFAVNANYGQAQAMLKDLERSIRPISVTSLKIQGSDTNLDIVVEGKSYYAPEKTVELKKIQV